MSRCPAYNPTARARILTQRATLAGALRRIGLVSEAKRLERDDAVGQSGAVLRGDVAEAAKAFEAQRAHLEALTASAEAAGNPVLVAALDAFQGDHAAAHHALYLITTEIGDLLNLAIDPRGA